MHPCVAALFTVAKIWKQPKGPSIDEMDGEDVGYIHTMDYYSAIKKNDVLKHVATWIN